jgi:hypothetical protein
MSVRMLQGTSAMHRRQLIVIWLCTQDPRRRGRRSKFRRHQYTFYVLGDCRGRVATCSCNFYVARGFDTDNAGPASGRGRRLI